MRKAAKILIGVLSVSALIGTGFASWTINYGYKTKTSSLIAPDVVVENYASFGEFIVNLKEEFDGETPKASPITFDAPADPMYNNINLGFVGGKEDLDVTYILKAQGKAEGQDPYSLSSIDRAAYDGITSEYIPDVTITTDIVDAEGNPVSDTLKSQVLSYVRTPEQVKGSDITIPYEAWLDPKYKETGYEHTLTFGWGELTNNINPQIYFLQEENHKTAYEFEQYLSNLKEVLYDSGIRFQFTFRIGGVDAYAVGATFDVDVTTSHVELITEPEDLTGLEAGTVVEFIAEPEEGYENPVVTFNGQVVEDSFTIIRGQNKLVATATLIDTTVPVSGITLNKEALALEVGGSETLTATVLPEDATDKTVTWSSSNSEVATVENGLVTAVAAGEATITATAGNFHAECVVTVSEPVGPVDPTDTKGTKENPYTVEEAIAAIDAFEPNQTIGTSEVYVTGLAVNSSSYNSKYKSYTTYLEAGEKTFQIYSAVMGSEVEGDYTATNALVGKNILVRGYFKIYQGTYEVSYLKATESPTQEAVSPVIEAVSEVPATSISAALNKDSIVIGGIATLSVTDDLNRAITDYELIEKSANFDEKVSFANGTLTGLAAGEISFKVKAGNLVAPETLTLTVEENTSDKQEYTVTKTMTEIVAENEYTVSAGNNATCYTSLALDNNLTLSTTGDANCGSFWGTGTNDWRLYQNKGGNAILTLPDGGELISVTFTFTNGNNGILVDSGSNKLTSTVAYQFANIVNTATFSVANSSSTATNGQIKITAVSVTYKI